MLQSYLINQVFLIYTKTVVEHKVTPAHNAIVVAIQFNIQHMPPVLQLLLIQVTETAKIVIHTIAEHRDRQDSHSHNS